LKELGRKTLNWIVALLPNPAIAAGIRKMPVIIIDHPDWWVRFTEGGLYVHKFSLAAQEVFHEHKVANVVEEGGFPEGPG
jgi:hypothetical protein